MKHFVLADYECSKRLSPCAPDQPGAAALFWQRGSPTHETH